MIYYTDDIIAAQATPVGMGGISIIRISGKGSIDLVDSIFISKSGVKIAQKPTYTMTYGNIVYNNAVIDEVIVSVMRAPNSYTCEDVVEINCHGGIAAVKKIMDIVVLSGARVADAGEFTKRAFLNGRIDITQAEAVIDIINSKTERTVKNALKQLSGGLSDKVKNIRNILIDIVAATDAAIDYPDDEIEEQNYSQIEFNLNKALKDVEELINTAEMGKMLQYGVNVVILGKPNVGKSSLLNLLLKEERAIVTDIPGTTRDTVEEFINIAGIPIKIMDTAGIRDTKDTVEKIGVDKAIKTANDADIILFLIDTSKPLDNDDLKLIDFVNDKKVIVILNKIDLECKANLSLFCNFNTVSMSIKENKGIDSLLNAIENIIIDSSLESDDSVMVSNIRHKNLLLSSKNAIEKALYTTKTHMPEDFVAIDIKEAISFLGDITGESLKDDIINRIFEKFCVGK